MPNDAVVQPDQEQQGQQQQHWLLTADIYSNNTHASLLQRWTMGKMMESLVATSRFAQPESVLTGN